MPILRFRDFDLDAAGRLLLTPGLPQAHALLHGELTVYVDRDAGTGRETYRLELRLFPGPVLSAFALEPGFAGQPFFFGWAVSHNATGRDAAGDVVLVDIELH